MGRLKHLISGKLFAGWLVFREKLLHLLFIEIQYLKYFWLQVDHFDFSHCQTLTG